MAKLNQIIAIEKGIKSQTTAELSEVYKVAQKAALFNGFQKDYRKNAEDGDDLPSESQRIQYTVPDIIRAAERSVSALMDVTARKDFTNCVAKAGIVVDGDVIFEDVPVTYLLFLEKQLTDIRTFFSHLPVLDFAEEWKLDEGAGVYRSKEIKTHKTQKVQLPILLYDATEHHPAQTQLITKDVTAGYWHQVKHSGAMEKTKRDALLQRTDKLLRAVKEAREAANAVDEVSTSPVSTAIFDYLLR